MQELIKRLRAAAIDAMCAYNRQVREGSDPEVPQWAMDTMALCKRVEFLTVLAAPCRYPSPMSRRPPAPPPAPATRHVRDDQYPNRDLVNADYSSIELRFLAGLREFRAPGKPEPKS